MHQIVTERYNQGDWNIYAAQASDGDNWDDDSPLCSKILTEELLPLVQYFSYIEITPNQHQALWEAYQTVRSSYKKQFAMAQIRGPEDIFPVFRELFAKEQYEEAV